MSFNKYRRIYWSDIKLFLDCPCCFHIKHRYGLWRPQTPDTEESFGLYGVADNLQKKEHNLFREWKLHPLVDDIADEPIDAIPFNDENNSISRWQNHKEGLQFFDKNSNILFCGIIDDVWISSKNELIIVDYKTTTRDLASIGDNDKYQVSFYSWVLKNSTFVQNSSYTVSEIAYLLYYSVLKDGGTSFLPYNLKLEFKPSLVTCKINYNWIEGILSAIYECLNADGAPAANPRCNFCKYRQTYVRTLNQISAGSTMKKF
ncbi:PD-(D/E)XK nuclease family protein [Candidatus Babeliales bacterium]|nr:PD-(D/E)XK nuclease family protein [Candidatus Babeliales bacterium]